MPAWLEERRAEAATLARDLPLPHEKTKGWEFTDLSGLDLDSFSPAADGDPASLEAAAPLIPDIEGAIRLDQVDGSALNPAGTTTAGLDSPSQPVVLPLDVAAERYPALVQARLGSVIGSGDPFSTRNDAAWTGGALVYVPKGTQFEAPVQLTAVQAAPDSALHWRTLIVLEEGAEAEVWEQYLSADGAAGLFNAVVEVSVGPGASLRYVCGQGLSERTWVFATQRAEIDRDANFDWVALGFGSARGKVRMETKLAGEGSTARVTGAYAGHSEQHLDFDTTQEHAAPHTTSDLAFRGVLEDRATAVWRGMIRVDPGAQRTDAFQESRNLLLSTDAHADAIPGLEIEANDVRCTHAAAVAQIDKTQLFYLMSRGLPRDTAARLIIDGFLEALVERLREGPIREAVSAALQRRLATILGA